MLKSKRVLKTRSKMCYKGKLFCIPIEQVCLVLAIISAIANLLLLTWFGLVWFLILVLSEPGGFTFSGTYHRAWIPAIFMYAVVPLVVAFNFIFSVLLCNGICAGRLRQIRAYFQYGVAITVLATLVAVMLLSCDSEQLGLRPYTDPSSDMAYNIAQGLWWLFGCVMHSLFLILVHQTHKKLKEDAKAHLDRIHLLEFGNTKQLY